MKNQAVKFIALCAIVCGSVVNAGAQNANKQATQMTPDQRIEMRVSKMTTSLNLTPDQATKVKDLFTAEYNARSSSPKDKGAMKASHAKMKDDMAKILTPEQMTKFNQMMEQQKAKHLNDGPKEN